ncbi:MAG: hypothetical protein ACE5K4_02605 [Candidatus Hydrothermarchaeota archaeon]
MDERIRIPLSGSLTVTERVVYNCILSNRSRGISQSEIKNETELKEDSIKKALDKLEEKNLVFLRNSRYYPIFHLF